jgi:hypothetical protein
VLGRAVLAWPNFSELTFAFAFLRELEALHGPYAVLPNFITQAEEATAGYDTEVSLGGTVLFIQFKRSEVMTSSLAKEFWAPDFVAKPVYRMHLHQHHQYAQHLALQRLEQRGNLVLYATSAASKRRDLLDQATRGTVISDSALFSPSEITLPDRTQPHHVSFTQTSVYGRIYSSEGMPFERRFFESDAFALLQKQERREASQNRKLLEEFIRRHNTPRYAEFLTGIESVRLRAAILARLRYDLELVITK